MFHFYFFYIFFTISDRFIFNNYFVFLLFHFEEDMYAVTHTPVCNVHFTMTDLALCVFKRVYIHIAYRTSHIPFLIFVIINETARNERVA